MTAWPKDELRKIAEADDLHISPFREDGLTYGTPTWIWSVAVDDALYVRAYNGQNSRWYRAAIRQKAGRTDTLREIYGDDFAADIRGDPHLRTRPELPQNRAAPDLLAATVEPDQREQSPCSPCA